MPQRADKDFCSDSATASGSVCHRSGDRCSGPVASKLFWACRCRVSHNSVAQFSASPDLQNEFVGAVIGAMHYSADLSAQILNNSDLSRKLLAELVPIIYMGLKATA
jgi:hypothetical protein